MSALHRLKALTRSREEAPPPPPGFLAVRIAGPRSAEHEQGGEPDDGGPAGRTIPWVWLLAGGLLLAAWIGWSVYSGMERGFDVGLGVFVAWPALLAIAAVATAPLAALVVLVARTFRGIRG